MPDPRSLVFRVPFEGFTPLSPSTRECNVSGIRYPLSAGAARVLEGPAEGARGTVPVVAEAADATAQLPVCGNTGPLKALVFENAEPEFDRVQRRGMLEPAARPATAGARSDFRNPPWLRRCRARRSPASFISTRPIARSSSARTRNLRQRQAMLAMNLGLSDMLMFVPAPSQEGVKGASGGEP